ncbi:MAG TPA: FAD-dependent oxidoreductase [Longimicrobiaceae bacterium]|nr:FAD-dependent oxidoreductase [Longimicrobiaceae bacterium]
MTAEAEFVVLGGGVAGLAAAAGLGPRALVLERESRPGGLVRTECFAGGYWFDRVLHVLHFRDPAVEARIRGLLGDELVPCPPVAWVECAAGTARYPLQLNLGALEPEVRAACLADYARAARDEGDRSALRYDEYLLRAFGAGLCEQFFFPYNRKQWKRPLHSLVPEGSSWNIARPTLEAVLRGALEPNRDRAGYNSHAFYPRPPAGAAVRGMEVLSRALAARAAALHLRTAVERIDPGSRTVSARRGGRRVAFRWGRECLCTLPLPQAVAMCEGVPPGLARAAAGLRHNRVLSLAFCVRGPRPEAPGHWRYYADEELCFTRLVFMTEFDPLAAPADGFGVLAEVTGPAELPRPGDAELLARAVRDLRRAGVLGGAHRVVEAHVMVADPGYVAFEPDTADTVERCRAWLAERGVATVGRYGRWEYSSMAQVMGDALAWAAAAGGGG